MAKLMRLWRLTKLPKLPKKKGPHKIEQRRLSSQFGVSMAMVKKNEQRYGDRLRMQVLVMESMWSVEGWDGIEFLELYRWEWEGGSIAP